MRVNIYTYFSDARKKKWMHKRLYKQKQWPLLSTVTFNHMNVFNYDALIVSGFFILFYRKSKSPKNAPKSAGKDMGTSPKIIRRSDAEIFAGLIN